MNIEDSYVAIGIYVCPVCGKEHSDNAPLLLDTQLKNIPKENKYIGYELCEEHAKLHKNGYLALVVVDNKAGKDTLPLEAGNRTGDILHIKYSVFNDIVMPECTIDTSTAMIFIDPEVYQQFKEMHVQH